MSSESKAPQPKESAPPVDPVAQEHLDRITDLFRRENRRLKTWLRGRLNTPPEDAEDIAAESFGRLITAPRGSLSHLAACLYVTARNLRANFKRDNLAKLRKVPLLEFELAKHVPPPESGLIEDQRKAVVQKSMDNLSPLRKRIFQLRTDDLSAEDIVSCLAEEGIKISKRTVQRHLKQGYEHLRQELDAQEPKQERSK